MTKAVLLLSDGTLFEGEACGAVGTTMGEVCFNTGMTGYQEIFSDPSYYGQIITMTTPHIGNYGAIAEDMESQTPKIAGLVTKAFSRMHSREGADSSLQRHLEEHGIVGISGIETRALVRHIREKGAMNAIISSETTEVSELKQRLDAHPSMDGLELSSHVCTQQAYWIGDEDAKIKVGAMDFGIKQNILRSLVSRGVRVKVFPAKTPAAEVLAENLDGYFLSNGPGDPAAMDYAIETVREIVATGKPTFGICLGHQLLALANGATTHKMQFGHRGINHPVKNLDSGKSEITSQNHGFVVTEASLEGIGNVAITHKHLNDHTVAGIKLTDKPAFSVQYHPESNPGPHDSRYLFDQFVEMMR